ncbi:enoyl-CoA hydratase/isomerase family protein [Chelatococcus reniformis]|uniref:enoyl-CoA hydratase/isomerase family protein n=1 Tax=Chelatococcus reniformis TaxID=1494448 RepID=UPI001FCE6BE9|nr:enoyl-CoA hydratase/isomerase family protein [Chelatococcus reniformis]
MQNGQDNQIRQNDEVLCERRGAAGVVVLNRPKALNALTLGMVRGLRAALDAWEHDDQVKHVVVVGAGDRAFCAGGDIRTLYEQGRSGRGADALTFWREEYQLNVRIKEYGKPYVALVEGIVMGGGFGVSVHGSHRVAGERFTFAMPEVGIGFFPDVGATYVLPRLPGEIGTCLALTGDRVGQAESLALGLATHATASGDLALLRDKLIAGEPVASVLEGLDAEPKNSPLMAEQDLIDHCFSAPTVAEILARLDEAAPGSPFAAKTAGTIRTKSPTSLALTLAQMRRGRGIGFREAMQLEYRIVSRIAQGHDFYEGVRAVIVDKDQAPKWQPGELDQVSPADIEAYFAPLGADELSF